MTPTHDEANATLPFGSHDLVPDETMALQVGTAILRAYLGQEQFAKFEPYSAHMLFGKWAVFGESPAHKEARKEQERLGPDHFIAVRGGGAPCITLYRHDGRVESINFMR